MDILRQRVPFFLNHCFAYYDIVHGVSPLSLPKAKANGLKSVKLFGGTEQSGTPTPANPQDIVCNNGVLKVNSQGQIYTDGTVETVVINLSDNLIDGKGTFVSPSATNTTRIYKAFGKLKAGTYRITVSSGFEFIFQYKDTMEGTPTTYGNIGTWATDEEFEITDTSMFYGIAIRNQGGSGNIYPSTFYNADGKLLFYEVNETATAEMLLKVGNYQDTQEVIAGSVTRNVGIKVLDGTENWQFVNTAYSDGTHRIYCNALFFPAIDSSLVVTSGYCTHFPINRISNRDVQNLGACLMWTITGSVHLRATQFTTLYAAKQWLKDQYNAGTPVIVIYPLATPTTESVAGQTLQVQAGNNTLEITQASLDNLTLEAEYKRGR